MIRRVSEHILCLFLIWNSAKTVTMPAILETDDVEAAVAKVIAAAGAEADGGVKRRVTDPFGFNWIFVSPAKDHNKKVNCQPSDLIMFVS